jgi:2-polyprenyl-6-methoxyphenol hydroxylase-like FAD-dependent oxidoreductase
MSNFTPVLIVGAGPTGLSMAIELTRYGIPFRIIDKQIKPVMTSNALIAQTRTIELWDDQNLLSQALPRGNKITGFKFSANHHTIFHADQQSLDGTHPFLLGISQHETETLLIKNLREQQVNIEMNIELIDLQEEDNEINVTIAHANQETEIIKTNWLIACDGAHSIIREKANMPFLGKKLKQHFVLADIKIKPLHFSKDIQAFSSPAGPLIIIQFDQDHARIIAEVTHDPDLSAATILTQAQLKKILTERCSIPLEFAEPVWTSGFWVQEKMVSAFRYHNIFFAGDAAHIHSPAGGQGMNTGIQDAYNLAWKLAFVIQHKSSPAILDSYHQERYPVAKSVLRKTTFLTRIMTLHNPILSCIRNFVFHQLGRIPIFCKTMFRNITQLDIHYKNSFLVKECMHMQPGPTAGTRFIDVLYTNNAYLMDKVRGIKPCLLIFLGEHQAIDAINLIVTSIKQQYPEYINFILIHTQKEMPAWSETTIYDENGLIHQHYQVKDLTFYFIRPDKYIGFRGQLTHQAQLIDYLQQLFIAIHQVNTDPVNASNVRSGESVESTIADTGK